MAVSEVDKIGELESMGFPMACTTKALHYSGEAIDKNSLFISTLHFVLVKILPYKNGQGYDDEIRVIYIYIYIYIYITNLELVKTIEFVNSTILTCRFYEGVVQPYNPGKKKHVILYDNGDVEVFQLYKEQAEVISEGSDPNKVLINLNHRMFPHPKECYCTGNNKSYEDRSYDMILH
ncbi:uncharacterized protein LOC131250667 [Magnolia sinica]|uniref:uncharacterized protein LOC131250667 n=1 Tax=Magnolia sinica TaxID=86752 RepID=UPI002658EE17|nr:uncharacterized protein LOC131250667 [Magnolia sinica]